MEMVQISSSLAQLYFREGRTSEAIELIRNTGRRLADVPNAPSAEFLQQADTIQALMDANRLPDAVDTSPLTLRFLSDEKLGLVNLGLLTPDGKVPPSALPLPQRATPNPPAASPADAPATSTEPSEPVPAESAPADPPVSDDPTTPTL
jgi:hypothetical protein